MNGPPNAKEVLKHYWGFDDFRGSQKKIIDTVLEKKDSLVLMPTGGGKSLCYQIPALMHQGVCIVISPLIALMQNQVAELKNKGIKAIALVGGLSFEDVNKLLDNCEFGNYKFLYLSPERLQQPLVLERLRHFKINLIAIDEAHCISQWGHDFRPAYLNCHTLRDLKPNVTTIALTATATKVVQEDILNHLRMQDPILFKDSFARKNISLAVKNVNDKRYQLLQTLKKNLGSSIVYVRTRKNAEVLSLFLNEKGFTADFFHGGLDTRTKKEKLNVWLKNTAQVMVATNAFGMGIDKSDVRSIVHFQVPDSIENYFQEIGRAGRDGQPATAMLLTNTEDLATAKKQFLDTMPDKGFLKLLYRKLTTYFQIAYGEGHDQKFEFRFDAFCQRYHLNPMLTYNGLRLLDQYSIIAHSENFKRKNTLRFLAKKQALFDYIDENPSLKNTVQTILRTYGGIFDFEVNINLKLISKKAGLNQDSLIKDLRKLETDGIINLKVDNSDLSITFLVPREDDKTINAFADKITVLNRNKRERFEELLNYIKNETQCRSIFLLRYFGENNNIKCGLCDICRDSARPIKDDTKFIKQEILQLIEERQRTSRELIAVLSYDERSILRILRMLLEDEKIIITDTNAYQIKK